MLEIIKKLTIVFGFLTNFYLFAQNRYLDSLANQLSILVEDSIKVSLMNQLAFRLSAIEPEKSLEYARNAVQLADKLKIYTEKARAYNALSIVYRTKGKLDSALIFLHKALDINESVSNEQGICQTLNGLGATYLQMDDFGKSLENFRKVLQIRISLKDTVAIANSFANIGNVYEKIENLDSALFYHEEAIRLHSYSKTFYDASFSYNSVGNIFFKKKELDKASRAYKKALDIYTNYNHKYGQAEVLLNFTETFITKKQYDSAFICLERAKNIIQEITANNLLLKILEKYAALFEQVKDYQNANLYLHKYIQLKDSLFSIEKNKQFRELEIAYQVEKKEKENQLLKNQSLHQRNNIVILSFVVIILSLVAYFLYRNNRQKLILNAMLAGFNEELQTQNEEI
ncbi:MAG: tetratricopeptide repeat protein, partial [Flammeovirgaceae bacterium]|nr:tetratricopeptide repeat protein [Flammeovirgaceae bacterium]